MTKAVIHKMKLLNNPYKRIKSGKKTVEIRLFDEKRQKLKIGDIIEFSKINDSGELNEKLKVKVIDLKKYDNFKNLVYNHNLTDFGYSKNYDKNIFIQSIYDIYTDEQEKQNGVLSIKIQFIN